MLLLQSYKRDVAAVARHLRWPEAKVQAAMNYSLAFPEEIQGLIVDNEDVDFESLKRTLPQTTQFTTRPRISRRLSPRQSR